MKLKARATIVLAAAMLLTWHGVMLAVPHDHADSAVPQEELACSASHPMSETEHLHGEGRILSPHPCLACLAGTAVPDVVRSSGIDQIAASHWIRAATATDLRSRLHIQLPTLRGPPPTS